MPAPRSLALLLTLASAGMVLMAWMFQYVIGIPPCQMCFWQRYPHMAAVFIGAALLVTGHRVFAWAGAAAMAITSGIGVYHSGVERKLWDGPQSCTGGDVGALSTQELLDQIMTAPLVRCDEIAWQMFGLTMPNLNAAGSFVLMLGWIWVARRI